MNKPLAAIATTLSRGLAAGAGYTATTTLVGLGLALAGVLHSPVTPTSLAVSLGAGTIMGTTVGVAARGVSTSAPRHWVIWTAVVFFNTLSVAIEGSVYASGLSTAIGWRAVQVGLASATLALLVTWLFASTRDQDHGQSGPRPWFSWAWRFLAGSFTYLLSYFVFGALNYALVTKPYYDVHVGSIAVPNPSVVLLAEAMRAPLIVLSLLPYLVLTNQDPRRRALTSGSLLFLVGGVAPLVSQAASLPTFLLIASGWEIFFQNFLTGLVVAALLGRPVRTAEKNFGAMEQVA